MNAKLGIRRILFHVFALNWIMKPNHSEAFDIFRNQFFISIVPIPFSLYNLFLILFYYFYLNLQCFVILTLYQ